MSKTHLRARPIFARTRDAIEAHLTIVFTAMAVSREVQNGTGLAIRNVVRQLRPLRSATIAINGAQHLPVCRPRRQTSHPRRTHQAQRSRTKRLSQLRSRVSGACRCRARPSLQAPTCCWWSGNPSRHTLRGSAPRRSIKNGSDSSTTSTSHFLRSSTSSPSRSAISAISHWHACLSVTGDR